MKLEKKILEIDGEQIACEFSLRNKNAVFLHGGGTSEISRYYKIAEAVYNRGLGVLLFNFSGHGNSSGKLEEASLVRRQIQAATVIKQLAPKCPLVLCGFSMGAQTLCDMLPEFSERTEAVLLACPAIYAESAHSLRFGNPDFTATLRAPESWKSSQAPQNLRDFKGKVVIAIGSDDEVIPKGVIKLLKEAAPQAIYREYAGATHKFAAWLSEHPQELANLAEELTIRLGELV